LSFKEIIVFFLKSEKISISTKLEEIIRERGVVGILLKKKESTFLLMFKDNGSFIRD